MNDFPTDPLGRFANYRINLEALLEQRPESDLHFHIDGSGSQDRDVLQSELVVAGQLAKKYQRKLFVSFFNHETHPEARVDVLEIPGDSTNPFDPEAEKFWSDLVKANEIFGGTSFDAVWRDVLEKNRTGDQAAFRINVLLSDLQWAPYSSEQMMKFSHTQPKNLYYLGTQSRYGDEFPEAARKWFTEAMMHYNTSIESLMLDNPWASAVAPQHSLDEQREELRSLNGTQWKATVGALWDAQRSRFAPAWDKLDHHTQLTVYRLLTAH